MKNNMRAKKYLKISAWLIVFLAVEAWSFISLYSTFPGRAFLCLLALMVFFLALYRLEYGLLIVLAELFVGSMGHLFTVSLGGPALSIRMALWFAIILAFGWRFLVQTLKSGRKGQYYTALRAFPAGKYFGLLALFVLIGLANGLLHGHPLATSFLDFNAWLYFLLLFPAVAVYGSQDQEAFDNLKALFLASVIWLSLKTIFLLFVFTHNLAFAPDAYLWLRRTLVGEMTATKTGWPRIFIQGQIFPLIAWFIFFWRQVEEWASGKIIARFDWRLFLGSGLFFSVALISFSRSFWFGFLAALALSLVVSFLRQPLKRSLSIAAWSALSIATGFLLIYLVAIFPYPRPGAFQADFVDRLANGQEAAISSRWSLLPVLADAVGQEPWLGQGYGATVTYISSDPRILEKDPSGLYTTGAFEWGYLDLWLKLGSLGLAAYLLLIYRLIYGAFLAFRENSDYLAIALAAGLVFLAALNVFTPYLNHPLGIGFLLLSSCLIRPDRV